MWLIGTSLEHLYLERVRLLSLYTLVLAVHICLTNSTQISKNNYVHYAKLHDSIIYDLALQVAFLYVYV